MKKLPGMNFIHIRIASILLLFVTGACGLVYEVTWFKYLANLIGSEARASALVLSVFLGGLSIGYALFGKLSFAKSPRSLMKMTGWLEIGIGAWAIIFPSFYSQCWGLISKWSGGALIMPVEIGFAALLILVPTILMGGTLPLLTQALSADMKQSEKIHAWIYSVNTAGAFLGCLGAGFYLLPHFGLPITLLITASFNLIAGITFLGLGTYLSNDVLANSEGARNSSANLNLIFKDRKILIAHVMAFLCGFVAITMQTALMRVVGLTAGSSEYSFAVVVSVFILMLAWGAYRVAHNTESKFNNLWINQLIVVVGLILIYFVVPNCPYYVHVLRALLTTVPANFYVYQTLLFVGFAILLIIPVHAMGRSMPLLFGAIARNIQNVGKNVGTIYFINTVGCGIGGIIGGYVLFYVFNIDEIFKVCEVAIVLTIILALSISTHKPRVWISSIAVAGILGVIFFSGNWDPNRLAIGTFRFRAPGEYSFQGPKKFYENFFPELQIDYRRDGPTSSMAVMRSKGDNPQTFSRSIIVNGKSDGDTGGDRSTVSLIAHLPALLTTADLKQVAVIGFGTGMTAGSLSLYPQVENIHIFEISPLVLDYAHYFDFANHDISKSPKVVWEIGDAYQRLLVSNQKYSIICSEPSNPWVIGVERLYSQEFLNIAKSKLEVGGVYAQWFHFYDISESTVGLVINTYSSVFKNVVIMRVATGDLAILGSDKAFDAANLSALENKFVIAGVNKDLLEIKIRSPEDLFAKELFIDKDYFANSGIHSLEFPKLSYAAGYDFFLGTTAPMGTLQDQPNFLTWTHKYAKNSLASKWNEIHKGADSFKAFVASSCYRPEFGFFTNWRSASRTCKQGLAASVQRHILDNDGNFTPFEMSILTNNPSLAKGGPAPASVQKLDHPEEKTNHAEDKLKFMMEYDSDFERASKDEFVSLAKECLSGHSFEQLRCRAQLIMTLATFGEWQEAQNQFKDLTKYAGEMPANSLKVIASAVMESTKAYAPRNEASASE